MRIINELSDALCTATEFIYRLVTKHDPNSLFEREFVRTVQ